MTPANFNELLNTAYCDALATCGGYDPSFYALCSGFQTITLFSSVADGIAAGRVAFNATEAANCVGAVEDAGCGYAAAASAGSCARAVTGEVADGGGCYQDLDCQNGVCQSETTCGLGACLGFVQAGGACDCLNCANCDPSANLYCIAGVCTTAATQGAACGGAMVPCASGLDCIGGTCAQLPVAAGSACNPLAGECVPGSYCLSPSAGAAGTCATQVALGQPCGQDAEHLPNTFHPSDSECAGNLGTVTCAGAGVLADGGVQGGICSPLSGAGEACTPPSAAIDLNQNYINGCFYGLNCTSAGVCATPPTSGTCSSLDFVCEEFVSFCDKSTNTCQPVVAAGGECNEQNVNQCGFGVCTPSGLCAPGGSSSCSL